MPILKTIIARAANLDDLQVDLVLVPAVTGDFGVMPGHVPTVAQLRPGVVTVHNELDKDVEKYFVSSGFAFVHADSSADVVAVEAVKLDELDTEAVRAGLQVTAANQAFSIELRHSGYTTLECPSNSSAFAETLANQHHVQTSSVQPPEVCRPKPSLR